LIKDKVEKVEWFAASSPARDLAFDHDAQIAAALDVLRNKVERHALPLHLMPENLTLWWVHTGPHSSIGPVMGSHSWRESTTVTTQLALKSSYRAVCGKKD
jgi:hypothetical protein